jgi:hypothetical protein
MTTIELEIQDIPHGHGISLKKGLSDGLLDCREYEPTVHPTHAVSYDRGTQIGVELKRKIAAKVQP